MESGIGLPHSPAMAGLSRFSKRVRIPKVLECGRPMPLWRQQIELLAGTDGHRLLKFSGGFVFMGFLLGWGRLLVEVGFAGADEGFVGGVHFAGKRGVEAVDPGGGRGRGIWNRRARRVRRVGKRRSLTASAVPEGVNVGDGDSRRGR